MKKRFSAHFVVGDWRIEPDCDRMVHCGGGERKLEPRLMRLLCCLAVDPGRTLRRDELIAELWPRVIVTENSLTRAVSELRKHLGAAGGGSVKIETVPKKGYRLVIGGAAGERRWRRAPSWPGFALPAFAAAIFAGGWLMERSADPAAPFPYDRRDVSSVESSREFVPASMAGGGPAQVRHEAPVLSADGGGFAFIRHDASGSTVWLGDLRGGAEPVAIYNSNLPLANLVWSPAGNALLFARQAAVAAEALYGGEASAQLMQFDLTTWTVSILVEASERADTPVATIDLT